MSIVIEMTRKQVFTGEIEPKAFVRTATNPETLALLTTDEMKSIADTYNLELNKREDNHGK